MDAVRIDKWLWAARFFKTRGAATEAVLGGHVHVGGARVKPAKEVRPGDTVEVSRGGRRWTVVVRALAERRGPAETAAAAVRGDAGVHRAASSARPSASSRGRSAPASARPTKQDRRRLEALRRGERRRDG